MIHHRCASMSRAIFPSSLRRPLSSFQRKLESSRGGEQQYRHKVDQPRLITILTLSCDPDRSIEESHPHISSATHYLGASRVKRKELT